MGAPPAHRVNAGRANLRVLSSLPSNTETETTTLHEFVLVCMIMFQSEL